MITSYPAALVLAGTASHPCSCQETIPARAYLQSQSSHDHTHSHTHQRPINPRRESRIRALTRTRRRGCSSNNSRARTQRYRGCAQPPRGRRHGPTIPTGQRSREHRIRRDSACALLSSVSITTEKKRNIPLDRSTPRRNTPSPPNSRTGAWGCSILGRGNSHSTISGTDKGRSPSSILHWFAVVCRCQMTMRSPWEGGGGRPFLGFLFPFGRQYA
jgi:hypothetical protein